MTCDHVVGGCALCSLCVLCAQVLARAGDACGIASVAYARLCAAVECVYAHTPCPILARSCSALACTSVHSCVRSLCDPCARLCASFPLLEHTYSTLVYACVRLVAPSSPRAHALGVCVRVCVSMCFCVRVCLCLSLCVYVVV